MPIQYRRHYEFLNQFQAAELIAERYGIDRDAADQFGCLSQQRAAAAWAEGRFDGQLVTAAGATEDGEPFSLARDEGLRETSREPRRAQARHPRRHPHGRIGIANLGRGQRGPADDRGSRGPPGLTPLARVVDSLLVGVDPVMMLLGPHAAVPVLLERNGLTLDDISVIEVNEAFASVVLSFGADEVKADPEKINPNGGTIALGHPLGATGCVLITKAVHELARTGGRYGLVTMCCGGGLGTATLLERL